MQNKGVFRFLAILIALVCLFQLSFTLCTRMVEKDAKEFAVSGNVDSLAQALSKGIPEMERYYKDSISGKREQYYLDSMSGEVIYNFAWIRKYTYKDCKAREINLGLDLKGGMNVTLEVSIPEIIRVLAGNSKDPFFNKVMDQAIEMQKSSSADFVSLFEASFKKNNTSNAKLASFFIVGLKDKINFNTSDDDVIKVIREETQGAVDRTFNILRTRIDRFGVAQPNIQKLSGSGRILIELPGIKDPERVRKLIQGTAKLEFWETYEYKDVYGFIEEADKKMKALISSGDTAAIKDTMATAEGDSIAKVEGTEETAKTKEDSSLVDKALSDSTKDTTGKAEQSFEEYAADHPLLAYLQPALIQDESGNYYPNRGPVVGYCRSFDTAKVMTMLRHPAVQMIFPREIRFMWSVKPIDEKGTTHQLVALKASRDGTASLAGDVIVDARQDIDQQQGNQISMSMNSEGATKWKNLTGANIGKSVAIVLDNVVYSFPTVQGEIPNGHSSITGNFTLEEAKDLANILKAGKLPAPTKIVEEAVVGPSLGKEAINAGLISFVIAFVLVLLYMALYYNTGGLVADAALLINIFFLMGVLASLGATLTLPGIAGIVLTMGMAVDANVIIYERIKEEVRAGKGFKLAVADGFKHAYSAIIDGNVTTLLTGIVLFIFGTGPIKGFATTLIIGIITSLFTAIFISRLVFEGMISRNKTIKFGNKFTIDAFTKTKINFIGLRKKLYIVSLSIIVIGIISLVVRGMSWGIDFTGGRTYVVRFDKDVKTNDIRELLATPFGEAPEVKTFGPNNQVKITTKYMIQNNDDATDSIVESKLYEGVKGVYTNPLSIDEFLSDKQGKLLGKMSSQKVGPTIADDIKLSSVYAIIIALIVMFVYIAIRFKKWQFGLGGVVSLTHDTLIVISMYSLFWGILPFGMEVDQAFIAAILTIIGYSINDTVIIFDRIREYTTLFPKRDLKENMNAAMNSTLGRTINTSGTTLVTLLAMFILGGEMIRGFIFALLVGITIGTYSSIFNATPVAYDFIMMNKRRKEKKAALQLPSKK
ncbi:MAG TPA: protein translocase subunit SecDF [Bacteroidales bacterium]|nr:protein translocase subunit SecDF [Bacteroidales bacterium]